MAEGFICSVIQKALGSVIGNSVGGIFSTNSNPITLACKCTENVDNLKQRVAELKLEKEAMEHYVEAVDRRGEDIDKKLQNWLTKGNNSSEVADKLVDDAEENAKKKRCFGLCFNPISRYQLSKKAKENSKAIAELVDEAHGFNLTLFHIPAPQREVAAPVKGFQDFSSRRDVLEKVMEALLSPSLHIIGVYGMPGVGKTMLVKEVKRRAEHEKLFDAVVMASVTRNADLKSIQDEIARGLGLDQLPNDITIRGAAHAIKARLIKMKKVLIILDDIWKPVISLDELGIPLEDEPNTNAASLVEKEHTRCKIQLTTGDQNVLSEEQNTNAASSVEKEHTRCKILLTSRDRNVLSVDMDAQKCFPVDHLNYEEGLDLFKKINGDGIQSHELQSTAVGIVEACGGLPLAITTIAKALRNKSSHHWRDALARLQRPSPENFSGISATIYSAIEVSYFHLESEELKKTFLLCSLMSHLERIDYIQMYGMGLGLFHGIRTMEKAEDRVLSLISTLQDSSLLLDVEDDFWFEMHDVVYDVAKSIASRDHHLLSLVEEEMPRDWLAGEAFKKCSWIDLWYPDTTGLPDGLECPQLTFFHFSTKDPSLVIPENFFKGMPRLRVLDLTGLHFSSSLPSSIGGLTNLVTLFLQHSMLGDVAIVGELKNLETLNLYGSDIEELPPEIGQLTQLKLLGLTDCSKLKVIPPGVLAGMSKLEVLHLERSFHQWDVEENENQRHASLAELKHLKNLYNLQVHIGNVQMIPNDLLLGNLKRYQILIGDARNYNWDESIKSSRKLKLQLKASLSFDNSVKRLLKTTEELHLEELKGVKNVVDDLNSEGFPDLKYLYVGNAPEVQHIINSEEEVLFNAFPNLEILFLQKLINLEKIFQGWFKETAFNKLRMITVECCDQVKNLFSSTIARQLLQLEEISVTECSNMEEIVNDEVQGSGNDIVEETQPKFGEVLRALRLKHLPRLSSFNRSCRGIPLFNEQVVFPNLEELHLSWINVNTIWHTSITTSYVEKLTKLIIEGCDNLEYLFSSSMARGMVMLGHLEIKQCEKMREALFMENVEDNGNLIFPQLRFLLIEKLPKLRKFYSGNYIEFPCLLQLTINGCPVLKTFISGSTFGHMTATSEMAKNTCTPPLFDTKVTFPKLQQLIIQFMESLDKIWDNQLDETSFCQLNSINVRSCKKLLNIFTFNMLKRLQRLDKLQIWNCDSLQEIFESQGLGAGQSQAQKSTPPTLMESVAKFVFSKLTHLSLYNLPKLKAFYHEMHSTKWPSLKKLEVCGCDQVWIFDSELSSFPRTNGDDQLEIHIKYSLFWTSKATFPSLEELRLEWNRNIKDIWHGQYIVGNYFPKLKVLELIQFPEQSVVQPFLFQSPNLENLVVSKAPFHEIFKCQGIGGVGKSALALTQLSGLRLSELHESTFLWTKESNLESVFYNLKTLEVLQCNKLKNLVPSFISFKNLTTLEVFACHELISLIGYSTAKSMVHLTRMSISECRMLKEIVACLDDEVKDGIVFSQLKCFQLRGLPRLASFCSGNCSFKFVSLEDVVLMGCPNMQIFSKGECNTPNKLQKVKLTIDEDEGFWEGNLNSTIQKMFREKVGYQGLENLKLSEFPELIEIWNKKPQEISPFKRLKSLEICDCTSLKYLLTPSMAMGLVQLHDLKVTNCAMMEQVITGEGVEVMFPLLNSIILESCSNLTCFYEGSSRLNFSNLKKILVAYCPILVTFASSFSSEKGKEIIAVDRENEERHDIPTKPFFSDKVTFPKLERLIIKFVWSLDKIWDNQLDATSFCQLNYVNVNSCKKLLNVFPFSMLERLQRLNKLEIRNCDSLEEIFECTPPTWIESCTKFVFSKLTHLHLCKLPKLKAFCHELHSIEWPLLKKLEVCQCDQVWIFDSELPSFPRTDGDDNLEIHIKGSLFWTSQATFPSLEELRLEWNRNMKHIWHGQYIAGNYFPTLKVLELIQFPRQLVVQPFLFQSPNLENLVVSKASFHEIFKCQGIGGVGKSALALTQLSGLRLSELHESTFLWTKESNLESVFYNLKTLEVLQCNKLKNLVPSFISFKNLTTLEVFACHELISLIGYSTAKSMVHLTRMSISECRVLKEIVACLDDEVKDGIVFSQLKCFQLRGLPRLASFCSGNCSFKFASLEDAVVMGCPNMQIFSKGECNTPNKLQKVKLTVDEDEGFWEGNLNSTIQKMFREKVGYQGLEHLKLSEFPELIEIWNKKPQEISPFKRLKSLEICDCTSLKYLLTPSMAMGLVQLHDLKVTNCAMMEQVITGEGVEEMFPLLNSIILESCSNLTCFYEGCSRLNFSNLKKILVAYCPILVTFASSFSREKGKEIIADGRGSEERLDIPIESFFNDKVVFPNLEELHLSEINVGTIWHTSLTTPYVEKLTKLIINGCDNLEHLFSSLMARGMVMLGHLEIKHCKQMREVLFMENVEDNGNLIFPQLRFLLMKYLPKLRKFCSGNYIEFPCLLQLTISSCPVLKTFISGSTFHHMTVTSETTNNTCTPPLFDTKVAFPRLEELSIYFMESLDKIWDNQLDATSFCQLSYVVVYSCKKLSNIFPFSMLERLQRLGALHIWNCDSLEEILKCTPPTWIESSTKFVFSKLTHLHLSMLPKLKAFCHEMHSIEWPLLKKLEVFQCDQVCIFDSELPSFPRTNGDDNLEIRIKHSLFWTSKATFPSLEELRLEWNGNMKEIWHGQYIAGNYFPKLKVLELMQSVVQPLLFQSPNITNLDVSKAPFHDIFNCQGLGGVGKPTLALTQLSGLSLSKLHESAYLWMEESNLESIFHNLKTLRVLWFNKLKNLLPSCISFKNLTTLQVFACHELISLIGYSTAKSMGQLTRMSIGECKMMKEIVACLDGEVQDGIVFSRLKYLELCDLPRLASFCLGNCNFEFTSLEEVIVMSCPNMHIFSQGKCRTPNKLQKVKSTKHEDEGFWEGNLNSTIQKMFMEKAGCHGLQSLMLSEISEWIEIWNKKPQDILLFKRLKSLKVCNCISLKFLLTPSMALGLVKLHHLEVTNCAGMEQVITGEGAEEMFPLLNSIILNSCFNLIHFYEGSSRLKFSSLKKITVVECPNLLTFASSFSRKLGREMSVDDEGSEERPSIPTQPFFNDKVAFPNLEELQLSGINVNTIWQASITSSYVEKLTELIINGCDNLKYLFSYSMARDLVMLRLLEINQCEKMREVLFMENVEENGNLIFPQLRFLFIGSLPKLRRFCYGNYIKFPCLSQLWISECPILKTFVSSSTFGHITTTSKKAKNICTSLFDTKVTFTKLEKLQLGGMKSLDKIWDNQLDADSLCQLNNLRVSFCEKLLNIFPFSMLEKLRSLDNLEIECCDSLEEIFESQRVGISQSQAQNITHLTLVEPATKFVFPTLTCLHLHMLPKLKAFYHQMHTIECPSLKELEVYRCDQIQIFASELSSFPKTKGDNDQLEIQTKYPLFWISKATFPSLEKLKLRWNENMKGIWHGKYPGDCFPKLTRMRISDCDMLKEIVAWVDDKEKDGIIVFSQLKYLELRCLPRLASFCSGNCSFEFPSLKEVIVMGCLNMQIFSKGECSTPNKLQKVKFNVEEKYEDKDEDEDKDEGLWEGNLNSTIQKMFTEKVGFLELEALELSIFPELIEIWNKKPQEILPFKNLKFLTICECNYLRYLLTTSMIMGLPQLVHLQVTNCVAMEQVIKGEGAEEMFPKLCHIILESCPNVKCFYEGSSSLKFPNLYHITVVDCPVLAAFASSFPSEQEKKITTNDREGEERSSDIPTQPFFSDKATFPRLRGFKLEGNNNMKEVWRGRHPGDYFPNLQTVKLNNFPEQLAVLPPFFFQSLPWLQTLVVSNASFDEIFQCEGVGAEENPANALPWLRQKPAKAKRGYEMPWEEKPANALTWFRELKLSKLHELKYLWKEELHLELVFYNLDILEVEECSKLKNLVPSFISFENLTTLKVSKCHGLIHVVGYSTAKSMVHLTRMSISECDMIDQIVALGDEKMKDGICFNDLEYLELCCLPKLASFCSGNCGFDFPSLEEVIMMECPNMQVFSSRQLSTPELQQVKLKDGNECYWYGDLNSTIQHLFMEKGSFDSEKDITGGHES